MADNLQSITFSGNVVDDAKLSGSDKNVLMFKVAQNQYDKRAEDNQHTHWFNCYKWFKDEGIASKFIDGFKKGASVTVIGKLSAKLNEKDGKSYMNLDVRVDDFTLPPKGAAAATTSKSTEMDDDIPF